MKNSVYRLSIVALSILAFQFLPFRVTAQSESTKLPFKGFMYLQPNVGVSQYYGDLNKFNYYNANPKFGFGAALGYQISPLFGIRGQFLKTNLYSERKDENLKFSSNLWDAAMNLTLNLNEIFVPYNEYRLFNFYVFTGAGITSYKSKIEDLTSSLVLNEHKSSQNELIVPVGAGISMRLSDNLALNLEYGDHITFKGDQIDFTNNEKQNDHYTYSSLGLQIRLGVKDSDGDGVKDKADLCPGVPGKVELAGCPDKDNDGIADKDDACPEIAGKAEFKGCPDTDNDGIPDKDDACPTVAGKKDLSGCPDKDGDGIADKDDKCPDMPGRKELRGCPDKDGDGIIDSEDACPDVKGLAKFKGCADTDGDGIPDNLDKCPDVAGSAASNGCPEVLKGAILKKTVYFNIDESMVLAQYIIILNEVAAYMNENPDARLSVAGHTDSRESAEYNMRLSEKRADYVIDFLKKKGMKSTKVEKTFFGKNKPVADNKTAEGRALNRRVEIEITK